MKSVNFGEANKYFFIFTKDFGLIKATAQGVRLLKSKLRYNLADFSFSWISVVRGKDVWRITSADKKSAGNEFLSQEKFLLISRIFSLLLRLLHGEEKNDSLFDGLKEGIVFLAGNEMPEKALASFECIMALRILSALGYLGQLGDFDRFTASPYFTPELILAMSALKSRAILEINKSLQETHL